MNSAKLKTRLESYLLAIADQNALLRDAIQAAALLETDSEFEQKLDALDPTSSGIGTGDVDGPASATDGAIAVFDGTTGKLIQNSAVTVDGSVITGDLEGNADTATLAATATTAASATNADHADTADLADNATNADHADAADVADALSATLVETSGGTGQAAYATGDTLYASAANTLSKLAVGEQTQIKRVIGGIPTWTDLLDPRSTIYLYFDFTGEPLFLTAATLGSGSLSRVLATYSTKEHPGVWRTATGTTTTGYGNVFTSNVDNIVLLGGGTTVFETNVRLSALSDGTNTYAAVIGYAAAPYNNVLPALNGIYFYADSNASANWRLRCQAAGVTTDRDTGIPITAGASSWIRLAWVMNSAGTSVQAFINGVAAGAPITTNIPTAAVQFQAMILKSAGTVTAEFDVDYIKFQIALATLR